MRVQTPRAAAPATRVKAGAYANAVREARADRRAAARHRRRRRRVRARAVAAGRLYRLSFSAKTLKRGTYEFVVTGDAGGRKVTRKVTARRL